MTYLLISAVFVAAAVAFAVAATLVGAGKREGASSVPAWTSLSWVAVAITGAVMLALTAVFDNLMIASDLFTYESSTIFGVRIGLAPVEDFTYPLAAALALPPLWQLLTRKGVVPMGELLREATYASRPVSWINTAFPFAAAMLLTTREITWLLVVGTIYYLIPYNLAMYGINDVFDYESDIKNPRKDSIEGALLAPRFHRPLLWLVVATNVPFLVVMVIAGNPASWAAMAVSTFAVIAYSAPKLRFKERPVLDSATSSTHFVSPAVVGLTLAHATWTPGLILVLSAFFLWGMAAHAFGAVQDVIPDREGGISSIATAFGARATVRFALALWFLAGVIMLLTPWPGPLSAIIVAPYLINCAPWFNVTDAESGQTNRSWRRFIWLNYFSGFLVTLILILQWHLTS